MWLPNTLLIAVFALAHSVLADSGSGTLEHPGLQPLILRANGFLAAGQFNDAINALTDALELSPLDYLLYYKRATAQLSLSRHAQALEDFEKVIKHSKGSFEKAYLMQGNIHLREGRWKEAKEVMAMYKGKDKGAQDVLFGIAHGEKNYKEALLAKKAAHWDGCIEQASGALESASHSISIRQLRIDCALEKGDVDQAVADMTRLTHLTSPSTSHFLRVAALSYHILPLQETQQPVQAIAFLKQCLHRDPDSKPCARAHRSYKSLEKSFARLEQLKDANPQEPRVVANFLEGEKTGFLKKYKETLIDDFSGLEDPFPSSIDPMKRSARLASLLRTLCKGYTDMKMVRKGEQYCEDLLKMEGHESDVDGLVGRGEACLVKEEWEDAVRSFDKAFEATGRSNSEVQQRLQRAQRMLKQAKKKDYYKVLEVSRDADERTIKKAYKKKAKSAHPDKGGSEEKMAAVNEAYEVLSNPELRQRFDNGDDPNDTTGGFGGGGHPFHGGFQGNPFMFFQNGQAGGGGPFQFHFSHGH